MRLCHYFLLQLLCFREENIILQVNMCMQIIFKLFQLGIQYTIGIAGFRRCRVLIAECCYFMKMITGKFMLGFHHRNGIFYGTEMRRLNLYIVSFGSCQLVYIRK